MPTTYKIIRTFFNNDTKPRVVRHHLTLAEAQAHCRDPETSSRTAVSASARARTRRLGPWFDGYSEEE